MSMDVGKASEENKPDDGENSGFKFWRTTLQSARYVVAPMVDQSELAWRMLSRRYGAELCYTPMFHAALFVKDPNYRRDAMQTCEADRPLIVQFCANDPDTFLAAALLAQPHCDAVDLNLGCPQVIAKNGHYGAYLQDEWDLIHRMVSLCHKSLSVPITCKIRVFPCVERTVQYARMLEAAGCQLLTVHGRTREMKGINTGIADWGLIRAVREAVDIPVFANGNIQYLPDVHRCIAETGVQGVMTAEGNLHNPQLFTGGSPCVWDMVEEYLALCEAYPAKLSYIRGHVFKLCHHALAQHKGVRALCAQGRTIHDFRTAMSQLKTLCTPDMEQSKQDPHPFSKNLKLDLPYWICQPYVRPDAHEKRDDETKQWREKINLKRAKDIEKLREEHAGLSMNKIKKILKNPHKAKAFDKATRANFTPCSLCDNPKGLKCVNDLCKPHCRIKVMEGDTGCPGHNFRPKKSQDSARIPTEPEEKGGGTSDNSFGTESISTSVSPGEQINSTDCKLQKKDKENL